MGEVIETESRDCMDKEIRYKLLAQFMLYFWYRFRDHGVAGLFVKQSRLLVKFLLKISDV